ncbi:MAG: hypothetical protein VBE63_24775 [Lamprobacter sp.]|uniref:hypothetical protein n=1 Tax=Lamprobacter sp. TaxID=3100796 RepID=UPI002B2568AF|nr:hypothetical protein [Lamprobacter sp.]MEA3643128.1 hypothetical protein [Lamprobacter sp.]
MSPLVRKPLLAFTRPSQDLGDQGIREPIALTRQGQQARLYGLHQPSACHGQQDAMLLNGRTTLTSRLAWQGLQH